MAPGTGAPLASRTRPKRAAGSVVSARASGSETGAHRIASPNAEDRDRSPLAVMRSPLGSAAHRHHTAARRLWLAALGCALGCAAAGAPRAPLSAPDGEPPPSGSLRVSLAFGDAADLDLYVTDPVQETVYYGNTPTRSGGALARDLRCDAPAPRVESVAFDEPLPGRYRVGVDYPERCRSAADPIPFVVVVDSDGRRHERRGEIELGRFLPVVLEVDVGGSGSE